MGYRKRIPRNLLPRDWYNAAWKRDVITRGDIRLLKLRGEKFDGVELEDLLISYPTIHIRTLDYYLSVQDLGPSTFYTQDIISLDRVDVFELMICRDIIRASASWIGDMVRLCVLTNSFDIFRHIIRNYARKMFLQHEFQSRTLEHVKVYDTALTDTIIEIIEEEWSE